MKKVIYKTVKAKNIGTGAETDIPAIKGEGTNYDAEIDQLATEIEDLNDKKQNKLTPGANIKIENDVISATGGGASDVTKDYVDNGFTSEANVKIDTRLNTNGGENAQAGYCVTDKLFIDGSKTITWYCGNHQTAAAYLVLFDSSDAKIQYFKMSKDNYVIDLSTYPTYSYLRATFFMEDTEHSTIVDSDGSVLFKVNMEGERVLGLLGLNDTAEDHEERIEALEQGGGGSGVTKEYVDEQNALQDQETEKIKADLLQLDTTVDDHENRIDALESGTTSSTNFFKDGVNETLLSSKYDLLKFTKWTKGKYVATGGVLTNANNFYYTDLIEISGLNAFHLLKTTTYAIQFAQYDENETFIANTYASIGSTYDADFSVNTSAKYVRFSVGNWSTLYDLEVLLNGVSATIPNSISKLENAMSEVNSKFEYIGYKQFEFTDGYYIQTKDVGQTINFTPIRANRLGYTIAEVKKGDIVTITATPNADSGTRPYIFVGADGKCLYRANITTPLVDTEIIIPYDCTLVVNALIANEHRVITGYKDISKKVKYSPLESMPEYIMKDLAYRPVGNQYRGYLCLTCDDGSQELQDYTIPMILSKNVPCTFSLWATETQPSVILRTQTGIDLVKQAVQAGCSVAQHGEQRWTEFSESDLDAFFENEAKAFADIGITPYGAVCPAHCINDKVRAIAGGRFGVVRAGYNGFKSDADRIANIKGDVLIANPWSAAGGRSNMFGLTSFNIIDFDFETLKKGLNWCIANNMIYVVYWHDWDLTTAQRQLLEDFIDYAKTTTVRFINLGDIPTLGYYK